MNSRNWMLLAIGFAALCMLFVALLSAVSFLVLSRRTTTAATVLPTWSDPSLVTALKIDPLLSAVTLGTTSELDAITQMQKRGELDSAYVATIYATSLSDRQRLGQLLFIGERYAAAENARMSRLAYQVVMDLVALSTTLSDFERAEALAQVATNAYRVKDNNLAALAIDEGRDIALGSPYLKDAHRFALLGKLLRAAQQGGDSARVKKLNDERATFVDVTDAPSAAPVEPASPLPAIDAPPKNDALAAALEKRVAAAQKIAELGKSATTIPDDLLSRVGDELFAEDDVRMRVYNAPTTQLTLAQKVALTRAQIDWLTLKYKVARKAFGVSIMPEWEDTEAEIRTQLAKAHENLLLLRNEQAIALPQTKEIALAGNHALRQQILAGRLGLYPRFPEGALVDELNDSTAELIQTQPNSLLRVKVEVVGDKYYYHLVNDATWMGETPHAPAAQPQRTAAPTRAVSTPSPASTRPPSTPGATNAPPVSTPAPAVNTPVPPTNTAVPPRPSPTRPYP